MRWPQLGQMGFAGTRNAPLALDQIPNMADSSRMPFRDYTQFDTATLDVMRKAHDSVVARRNLKSTDPLTGRLRRPLLNSRRRGVTDLDKLTEQAASARRRM
jgi:hypothetical protein